MPGEVRRREGILPYGFVNCAADDTAPFRLARTLRNRFKQHHSPFRSSLPMLTSHRKQAAEVCRAWAKASLHGETLNADKAREIIAAGVADVLAASGESLPSATIREWCKRWLAIKEVENEATSHTRYQQASPNES